MFLWHTFEVIKLKQRLEMTLSKFLICNNLYIDTQGSHRSAPSLKTANKQAKISHLPGGWTRQAPQVRGAKSAGTFLFPHLMGLAGFPIVRSLALAPREIV